MLAKAERWLESVKDLNRGPGCLAQLVRAPSQYAKVAGSVPGQGTCKSQPMKA